MPGSICNAIAATVGGRSARLGVGNVTQGQPGSPAGEVYDWYTRGLDLLRSGDSQAASLVLQRVVEAEPESRAAREALARAQYDSGEFALAREHFATNLLADPSDDYAAFGVGLCASRLGEHRSR